jgi:hypothetical protein
MDFQKAFNSVWRDGLLYKLANIGIGKYFYSTEITLKIYQKHSEYFEIFRGVKQGDSIRPTLFNIFINDLSATFNTEEWFFVSFRNIFSDNTRIRILIFFPECNIRLYDKNSESDHISIKIYKWTNLTSILLEQP